MRVLHLSSYDLYGGAARAAFRLHTTLKSQDVDSLMLVRQRRSTRADVVLPEGGAAGIWRKLQRRCDRLPLTFKGNGAKNFSVGWVPDGIQSQIKRLRPDLIHLHWVCDGFFHLESLRHFTIPVVWTMHDMWTFTGGCHYSGSCIKYQNHCGHCPVLGSHDEDDYSRQGWERRRACFSSKITYIAPSKWLADRAQGASLLKGHLVSVIPNGLDTGIFRPQPRLPARRAWGLDPNKVLILAGAMGLQQAPRKGFGDVVDSLKLLGEWVRPEETEIITFGSEAGEMEKQYGFRIRSLGVIADQEKLASLYAAADLFVAPSHEDNLPNTLIEAMSAGIPAVAYRAGGIPEIVDHEINGLLVAVGDVPALAENLGKMINGKDFRDGCGRSAREKVLASFSQERSSALYKALYKRLLDAPSDLPNSVTAFDS